MSRTAVSNAGQRLRRARSGPVSITVTSSVLPHSRPPRGNRPLTPCCVLGLPKYADRQAVSHLAAPSIAGRAVRRHSKGMGPDAALRIFRMRRRCSVAAGSGRKLLYPSVCGRRIVRSAFARNSPLLRRWIVQTSVFLFRYLNFRLLASGGPVTWRHERSVSAITMCFAARTPRCGGLGSCRSAGRSRRGTGGESAHRAARAGGRVRAAGLVDQSCAVCSDGGRPSA